MNPYAIIRGLLFTIAVFFVGTVVGHKLEQSSWQAKEIETMQANEAAMDKLVADRDAEHARLVAENEAQRKDFAEKTRQASVDHEQELAAADAKYRADLSKRVRVSAKFYPPARSAAANSTGKSPSPGAVEQAAPPAQFLPEPFVSDLRQLARDADRQLADLRQLVTDSKNAKCFEGYD